MKILFVSPFPPSHDGIGTWSEMMVVGLRAAGHEALVVAPRAQGNQPPDIIGTLNLRKRDLAILRETVMAWDPDVIHIQYAFAAFGARTLALFSWLRLMRNASRIPVIVTMHEVTRDTAALRRPGRLLYCRLAAECDHVIVHTRAAISAVVESIGVPEARVSLIPLPEPTPPRAVSTPTDLRARFGLGEAELLVAFGFIHVDKGLEDLVQALATLRRVGVPALDDVRLVIAGAVRPRHGIFLPFEYRDRLHLARVLRKARRAALHQNIVLTGYVSESDVAGWFQAAAAVVLPYRRTEQSAVAALANAFGVPVLASTAGGLGEQYSESQWTFPPRDPRNLSSVLARFLATPPNKRGVTTLGRSSADLNFVIRATHDVYLGAVGPKTGRPGPGCPPKWIPLVLMILNGPHRYSGSESVGHIKHPGHPQPQL